MERGNAYLLRIQQEEEQFKKVDEGRGQLGKEYYSVLVSASYYCSKNVSMDLSREKLAGSRSTTVYMYATTPSYERKVVVKLPPGYSNHSWCATNNTNVQTLINS